MKRIFTLTFLVSFISLALHAQIKVISPCAGVWSNKQVLVIDTEACPGDYYYSLNGTDPSVFGFAYDGPVLIDLKDDVSVKIAVMENSVKKDSAEIKYTVVPDPAALKPYSEFIQTFYDTGIYNYTSGSVIELPQDLTYLLGKSVASNNYLPGRNLKLAQDSILSRYIPCIVNDAAAEKKWFFVIRTVPRAAGTYSRRDVPFKISDWNTIEFLNDNYIYKIDSEYWELPKQPKFLDRTISHMISWQSIDYQAGNPVEFFVLPAKPEVVCYDGEDGEKVFTFAPGSDESYAMGIYSEKKSSSSENEYNALFRKFSADTFHGDLITGSITAGIYSNSVYQGNVTFSYEVDKYPPSLPKIVSDSENFYSRKPALVKISSDADSELFYGISEPYIIDNVRNSYSKDSVEFQNLNPKYYQKSERNIVSITLKPQDRGAVYFKICAYAKKGEFTSPVAQYSVIVDQYNYYYDKDSTALIPMGTAEAPFTDFSQCLEAVNNSRHSCIHIKSSVDFPEGVSTLSSNCIIDSDDDSVLYFSPGSSLVVKSASLELNGCNIKTKGVSAVKNKTIIPLIKLENSVLDMNDCVVSTEFGKTSTLIDGYQSSINILDSTVYTAASTYASCITGVKSRLNIKNSVLNSKAETSVVISVSDGELNLSDSSLKTAGSMGRIIEMFASKGVAKNNKFLTELEGRESDEYPVYLDKKSSLQDISNVGNGF